MSKQIARRDMLRNTSLAGVGVWLAANRDTARSASPNEKLNIAMIGIGGRGSGNLGAVGDENIVALCDVDDQRAGKAFDKFPKAKKYIDYRRMLEEMESQIDAVVVSTPDHTHAHPSVMAMRMGKHLFCEKPMGHSVYETRVMTEVAAEQKVATQLGAQRHALDNVHRVVELVQSGAVGEVRECYAWKSGSRGMPEVPTEFPPVPPHLNWDLWLGPAADRPYSPAYVPYEWRFWWDFGTGETGNWGCHILDIPYWALGLKYPTRVEASGPPVDPQRTPKSMATQFEFPARGHQPPVTLHWSHTSDPPAPLSKEDISDFGTGVLFVGSKGMLLSSFSKRKLLPESDFADFEPPEPSVPDSPGFHQEWINACKGGPPATCNFDYSGPMAETVLLGNVAYRAGSGFKWDAAKMKAVGCPEADQYVRPTFRDGWPL